MTQLEGQHRKADTEFRRLLDEARQGSRQALGRLLESCRAYLLKIANRELPDKIQAKGGPSDVVQQSFLRAQQGFDRFEGDCEPELLAWLRRILLNDLANFRRHYCETEKREAARELSLTSDESSSRLAGQLRQPTESPSELVAKKWQTQQLTEAMERLPEAYRRVLVSRFWQRMSFVEIAEQMDRTPNAVRKLWLRAIERLHDQMVTQDEQIDG